MTDRPGIQEPQPGASPLLDDNGRPLNPLPCVSDSLRFLSRWQAAVRDFTGRADQLAAEQRQALARQESQQNEQLATVDRELAEHQAEVEASFAESLQRIATTRQRRRERIPAAGRAVQQRQREAIERQEGQKIYELQRRQIQLERERDEGLKRTAAAFEQYNADLADAAAALAQVEAQARHALRGFGGWRRRLVRPTAATEADLAPDEYRLLERLRELTSQSQGVVHRIRRQPLALWFHFLPLWLWLLLAIWAGAVWLLIAPPLGLKQWSPVQVGGVLGGFFAAMWLLHLLGSLLLRSPARRLATALGLARNLLASGAEKAAQRRDSETDRFNREYTEQRAQCQQQWDQARDQARVAQEEAARALEAKTARALRCNEFVAQAHRVRLERQRAQVRERLDAEANTRRHALDAADAASRARLESDLATREAKLASECGAEMARLQRTLTAWQSEAARLFPPWNHEVVARWSPLPDFVGAVRFGCLEVETLKLSDEMPRETQLPVAELRHFSLPLLLQFPEQGSILFETKESGRAEAVAALNQVVLRLLAVAPPGRIDFTVIDPVELGQNFAGLMHLTDFAERLVNRRIWTQAPQIEAQLARLNEHIEKVTQMYLRNEFATIVEYNAQAGRIAEKFYFVVIADFPANFSETALKRLQSLIASGPRCGVYTLLHWDTRRPVPPEFLANEARRHCLRLCAGGKEWFLGENPLPGAKLVLDAPPDAETTIEFLQRVGRSSVDADRVEMPFTDVAPAEADVWTGDATDEVRVPIGRTGAVKQQLLALGKGTRQHALIAGKTGSGKSTLFHVLITNLALWCSPAQIEFYLVDFKKGVEFKCYATHRLPHARVVAIESDREFALSVLERVDAELRRRGDLFRAQGVQDLPGYKAACGQVALPRTLLLIDEFQEFFTQDDRIAQSAALLLDRIVRQGRAFGIHVVLGSQTLGGAYTLARSTLGQMVVRIALQCNEADAYLIMDENNAAPRLLSRPGEGIYNDTAGTLEGNSPFQVVWLPDATREAHLRQIRERADRSDGMPADPIVFEGNAPANARENAELHALLRRESIEPTSTPRAFLGAPNSIKGPTEVVFRRQSGNHLLIVGQREEAALAMLGIAFVSLAVQHLPGTARFILLDASPPETASREFLERIVAAVPHPILLAKPADVPPILTDLAGELARRAAAESTLAAPAIYLAVHTLPRFPGLRPADEFGLALETGPTASPGAIFQQLLFEGPPRGLHVLGVCDTFNNVNRFLSRKGLSEFAYRVLFQMSDSDSASLIDSTAAGNLGLHRAILHNANEGFAETFRPYALPDLEWVSEAGAALRRLIPGTTPPG